MRLHLTESVRFMVQLMWYPSCNPWNNCAEVLQWEPLSQRFYTKKHSLTHIWTKILIQSANYGSGQEDHTKEAIWFVRALKHNIAAMKEVWGRHSHFGHPYGARVQFRDSLVCLITTFPNSIILQQHHKKNTSRKKWHDYIQKECFPLLSHKSTPLHEISLLFAFKKKEKRKMAPSLQRDPTHVWKVAYKNIPQQDQVYSHKLLPSQNTLSPLSLPRACFSPCPFNLVC